MARSDSRPASDDVMRAIAHELAEAAPPPPDWTSVASRSAMRAAPDVNARRPRLPHLLLVAAVTVLVIGGLWYPQRADEPAPADVPPEPTEVPQVTLPLVAEGLRSLDAVSIQTCLIRRNARLVLGNGLLALDGRESLPGYTVDRARLGSFRPMVAAWSGIVAHPDLQRAESAEITSILDEFAAADALAFAGPDSTEGEGFGRAVTALEDRIAGHLDRFDDPVECSSPGMFPTASAVRREGECVALWRLREAIGAFASDGRPNDDFVVETAAESVRLWPDPVQLEYVALGELVASLIATEPVDRDVDAMYEAIDDLLVSRTTPDCEPLSAAPTET